MVKKTYASLRKPCFRSSKIPHLVFTSFVSMLGPKPEDPSDLSPPDELSQARRIASRVCFLLPVDPLQGLLACFRFFLLCYLVAELSLFLKCLSLLSLFVLFSLPHCHCGYRCQRSYSTVGGRVVRSATCTCIHYENKCPWRN